MRKRRSGSKWMTIAAVALLAAVAWNTYRTSGGAPVDVIESAPVSTDAGGARTTSPLELPPLIADDASATRTAPRQAQRRYPEFLPPEAIDTLALIERGGPYPYRQDDGVFGNRERRLPAQPRGYYREYTVKTPGSRDRGARRIVAGGRPPVEYFYTDDHYRSFRRFTLDSATSDSREASR